MNELPCPIQQQSVFSVVFRIFAVLSGVAEHAVRIVFVVPRCIQQLTNERRPAEPMLPSETVFLAFPSVSDTCAYYEYRCVTGAKLEAARLVLPEQHGVTTITRKSGVHTYIRALPV